MKRGVRDELQRILEESDIDNLTCGQIVDLIVSKFQLFANACEESAALFATLESSALPRAAEGEEVSEYSERDKRVSLDGYERGWDDGYAEGTEKERQDCVNAARRFVSGENAHAHVEQAMWTLAAEIEKRPNPTRTFTIPPSPPVHDTAVTEAMVDELRAENEKLRAENEADPAECRLNYFDLGREFGIDFDNGESVFEGIMAWKARVEKALKPFAEISLARDHTPDSADMIDAPDLSINPRHVRDARAALSAAAQQKGGDA